MMGMIGKQLATIFLLTGIITAFAIISLRDRAETQPAVTTTTPVEKSPTVSSTNPARQYAEPISGASTRITKKPYGIYVTPGDSPVSPERFTGYHTGTDFEATSGESGKEIPIKTICPGTVRFVGTVSGYGGVLIHTCIVKSEPVTVLYGHIDTSGINIAVGDRVDIGEKIAILAPAYSLGSGGERKHLHLGIHRGGGIDFRGYVQDKSELTDWLDYKKLLK